MSRTPTPIAPPTDPAHATAIELDLPPASRWPRAIGITAIILGSISLLFAGCNVVGMILTASFLKILPAEAATLMDTQTLPAWLMIAGIVVNAALAIMLIIVGNRLVNCVRPVRGLAMCWSGLQCVLTGVILVAALMIQWQKISTLADSPMAGAMSANFVPGAAMGGCVWVVTGLALPIFGLVWFNRGVIIAEIESWPMRGEVPSPPPDA